MVGEKGEGRGREGGIGGGLGRLLCEQKNPCKEEFKRQDGWKVEIEGGRTKFAFDSFLLGDGVDAHEGSVACQEEQSVQHRMVW